MTSLQIELDERRLKCSNIWLKAFMENIEVLSYIYRKDMP